MGGRYAQSWLFYGWGKNVSRETFSIVTFAFASVFCIGSSNSGVDNTTKPPVFCSTNRFFWILLCPVLFCSALRFFCYPSPVPPWLRTVPCLCSFAGLTSIMLCTSCVTVPPHAFLVGRKSEFGRRQRGVFKPIGRQRVPFLSS